MAAPLDSRVAPLARAEERQTGNGRGSSETDIGLAIGTRQSFATHSRDVCSLLPPVFVCDVAAAAAAARRRGVNVETRSAERERESGTVRAYVPAFLETELAANLEQGAAGWPARMGPCGRTRAGPLSGSRESFVRLVAFAREARPGCGPTDPLSHFSPHTSLLTEALSLTADGRAPHRRLASSTWRGRASVKQTRKLAEKSSVSTQHDNDGVDLSGSLICGGRPPAGLPLLLLLLLLRRQRLRLQLLNADEKPTRGRDLTFGNPLAGTRGELDK
ncbi:Hypothetical predicted protein [Olea europaea subsp. europaea]|uniref:Uncharacterized protein n=1 Tax=Olea europaea subsp. europaea TaxID=158383 RepID=A0A8S0TKJ1_OLEEU|nr:Hypothetical predicted protein [Olea europaea subsp. europaea]